MKENIISDFVKGIAPEITVKEASKFEYDYIDEIVFYDPKAIDEFGFMESLKREHGFACPVKYFTVAILHELGHFFTEEVEDDENDWEARWQCAIVDKDFAKINTKIQEMYYNITTEFAATEWAINYINNNLNKCLAFEKRLFA